MVTLAEKVCHCLQWENDNKELSTILNYLFAILFCVIFLLGVILAKVNSNEALGCYTVNKSTEYQAYLTDAKTSNIVQILPTCCHGDCVLLCGF